MDSTHLKITAYQEVSNMQTMYSFCVNLKKIRGHSETTKRHD